MPSATDSPGFSIDWNFGLNVANASKVEVTLNEAGRLTLDQGDARYAKKEETYEKKETYSKAEINNLFETAGSGSITVSDTAPDGDASTLWVDTASGGVQKYWNGTEWVAGKAVWG